MTPKEESEDQSNKETAKASLNNVGKNISAANPASSNQTLTLNNNGPQSLSKNDQKHTPDMDKNLDQSKSDWSKFFLWLLAGIVAVSVTVATGGSAAPIVAGILGGIAAGGCFYELGKNTFKNSNQENGGVANPQPKESLWRRSWNFVKAIGKGIVTAVKTTGKAVGYTMAALTSPFWGPVYGGYRLYSWRNRKPEQSAVQEQPNASIQSLNINLNKNKSESVKQAAGIIIANQKQSSTSGPTPNKTTKTAATRGV